MSETLCKRASVLLKNQVPSFNQGGSFLSYKQPGGETFTSFSPSVDSYSEMLHLTGKDNWRLREFMQSPYGTQLLSKASSTQLQDAIKYMGYPGYHSPLSCSPSGDTCGKGTVCTTDDRPTVTLQRPPACLEAQYPEIENSSGAPIRIEQKDCKSDLDCRFDSAGNSYPSNVYCNKNHSINGGQTIQPRCQYRYECPGGERHFMQTPEGWDYPLDGPVPPQRCEYDEQCGGGGVNGWTRCREADDGNKYCVWPATCGMRESDLEESSDRKELQKILMGHPKGSEGFRNMRRKREYYGNPVFRRHFRR